MLRLRTIGAILCGQSDESIDHVLMHCQYTKACWRDMNFHPATTHLQAFRACLFMQLQSGSTEDVCIFALVAWIVWRQPNDRMWNSSRLSCSRSSSQLGVRLLCAMEGSSSLSCQYASRHDRGDLLTTAVSKWEASLKCNMDAAVLFSQNLAMGTRFIIRDHRGQVLWCGCWQNRGIYNPLMAEALANLASTRDNRDGY